MKRTILKKAASVILAAALITGVLGESMYVPAFAADEVNSVTTTEGENVAPTTAPTTAPTVAPTIAPTPFVEPTEEPETTPEPVTPVLSDKVYIANYRVVDNYGNSIAKIKPGDKVIVSVTVIDERINAAEFGVPAGANTGRIHPTMSQGAFVINAQDSINVKMRDSININYTNLPTETYPALCYTVTFRDVTYRGGKPDFGFGVSYTGANGSNVDNNVPLPVPHTMLSLDITQASDDVPAPTIILNSANYGKVAMAGQPFTLNTSAINTSENLELENVSVQIVLPQGITMASGNSQVLIGKVGKRGTVNQAFNLVAEAIQTDTATLPVDLVYTFEAVVNGARTQYTSTQKISINVQQQTRFDIQGLNYEEVIYQGNSTYMSAQLVNKGKSTVYNVTAEIVSDKFTGSEVEFLGNIQPGSKSDAEFEFYADELGSHTGKVVVTYEDASGTQYKLEKEFSMEVMENVPFKPEMPMDPMMPEDEKGSFVPYVIGVVAVAAVGFVVYKKKMKAKRLAELEDEDEDI